MYVYIITNKNNTVLYTGVTNNLERRMLEHKQKINPNSFASKYNCNKLIYFEEWWSEYEAIDREKEIKLLKREKKILLIENMNPYWKDLSDNWYQ